MRGNSPANASRRADYIQEALARMKGDGEKGEERANEGVSLR